MKAKQKSQEVTAMQEKLYPTPCGEIHYWVNRDCGPEAITLVFLPGLTADHRLFDKQIACFEGKYNLQKK